MNFVKCMMKDILFIGIGIGGTLVYQRYNKQIGREIEKLIDKTVKKVDDSLEEMM